ncbi:MAG: alpha/beta fold hydrolase [Paracoccaceae bacterium]
MFPGFETRDIETSGARIRLRLGGNGPPLLLLHGNPQTSAMWRHVAPALADRFTCVCPDLRGYGFSSKPPPGERHINYAKREMARDMVEVMETLGHSRFHLCGHDRGGRVAHRLAYDWPDRVTRVCVLDIAPTREMYANTTDAFARAYWHWFFMILPHPIPERMFGADPEFTLRKKMGGFTDLAIFEGAWEEYLEAFRDPETIRATCDDYRAAATIDIEHDDAETGKLAVPLLCLWGAKGVIERCFDPLALWRQRAADVRGHALPCGHFMPEELPGEITRELAEFFGAHASR